MDFDEIYEGAGRCPINNRLHFGGDPDRSGSIVVLYRLTHIQQQGMTLQHEKMKHGSVLTELQGFIYATNSSLRLFV